MRKYTFDEVETLVHNTMKRYEKVGARQERARIFNKLKELVFFTNYSLGKTEPLIEFKQRDFYKFFNESVDLKIGDFVQLSKKYPNCNKIRNLDRGVIIGFNNNLIKVKIISGKLKKPRYELYHKDFLEMKKEIEKPDE